MTAPTEYRFTVPGEPVPWKRARRGNGHSFTDPKDAAHREKIRAFARNAGVRVPLAGPLYMSATFYTSKPPLHPQVGDRDNYLKALKDALEGIAYKNDRQVVAGPTVKAQDEGNPRTEVWISIGVELVPSRVRELLDMLHLKTTSPAREADEDAIDGAVATLTRPVSLTWTEGG